MFFCSVDGVKSVSSCNGLSSPEHLDHLGDPAVSLQTFDATVDDGTIYPEL